MYSTVNYMLYSIWAIFKQPAVIEYIANTAVTGMYIDAVFNKTLKNIIQLFYD